MSIASADRNAQPDEFKNLGEKKLAFLGRFNYGIYSSFGMTSNNS